MTSSVPTTTALTARRTLSPRIAFGLVAAIIGLALFASGTPSPLYGTYRELWGFSPVVLTLVYATYAFGVLATLIARRPDLRRGRAAAGAARRARRRSWARRCCSWSPTPSSWLFVARGVQGLATGLALGAASAALLDLHPRRDPAGVGLTNGVVSAGGHGPRRARVGDARRAAAGAARPAVRGAARPLRDRVRRRAADARAGRGALAPAPDPAAPAACRRASAARSCSPRSPCSRRGRSAGCSCRSGRSSRATLFHTDDHLVAGLSVFALAGSGAVAQLLFGRTAPWVGAASARSRWPPACC